MIPALILLLVAAAYRVVFGIHGSPHADWMLNFSPVAAIALCGGLLFPKRLSIAVPLGILFVSDLILNAHYGVALVTWQMGVGYLALLLIGWLGVRIARSGSLGWLLAGSVAASVIFYLTTNTVSWLAAPEYAKTVGGWAQALTTGVPGYPPTWVFFRNSLVSDFVFTACFLLCWSFEQKPVSEQPAPAQRPA